MPYNLVGVSLQTKYTTKERTEVRSFAISETIMSYLPVTAPLLLGNFFEISKYFFASIATASSEISCSYSKITLSLRFDIANSAFLLKK